MCAVKRVLVVDDSKFQLQFLKSILEQADYEVKTSDNIWVLKQVIDWQPDLILMDVEMDGFNGADSVRTLKNTKAANIPIVLHSGKSEEELEALCKQCRADGYLKKAQGDDIEAFIEAVGCYSGKVNCRDCFPLNA